ncbi:hypothetical protein GF377_04615 [candidate division GN15 bacterium]|nr:hypothetical protein [candidate division GN15 bacterium]
MRTSSSEPSSSKPSKGTDETSKRCGGCRREYSVVDIISSATFRPLGLQTGPPGSNLAGVFFLHDTPSCQGSILVPLDELRRCVLEPVPEMTPNLGSACNPRCQEFRRLDSCTADCHFAPFQRMLMRHKARLEPSLWAAGDCGSTRAG